MQIYNNIKLSLRFIIISIILLGVIYPILLLFIGQILFPHQAGGSLIKNEQGQIIGSELIGQNFSSEHYFLSRPSDRKYNPIGHRNVNDHKTDAIRQKLAIKYTQNDPLKNIPADFLTNSASGLDPHISLPAAYIQITNIAKSRNISALRLQRLIQSLAERRFLGILGEERINVLKLNIALEQISKKTEY